MLILDLVQPDSIEDAYKTLIKRKSNTVLGGCAFLRMSSKRIGTAIDLSKLNLNFIQERDDYIETGAMATLRDIETNPVFNQYFCGVLPKSISNIIGVQFRNVATVGASVFSKYGFSDLLTALLVLDTEVELYNGGSMLLEKFLDKSYEKDILTRVLIPKKDRKAAYQSLRNSASDYPILNVAVSNINNDWLIAVGARPLRAKIARKASDVLSQETLNVEKIEYAANKAAEELSFGTNTRGTAEYRKAICKVLVKRAITEVLQCK
ncbi:MAG: FAD binding domain-containing protein [Desulfitobacteriaceae bacterium]